MCVSLSQSPLRGSGSFSFQPHGLRAWLRSTAPTELVQTDLVHQALKGRFQPARGRSMAYISPIFHAPLERKVDTLRCNEVRHNRLQRLFTEFANDHHSG